MSRTAKRHGVIWKTCVHWTTGLVFGLIVAFVIVLLSPTRPMRILQTWGQDLGMRVLADPNLVQNTDYLRTDVPFVFVDIDRIARETAVGPLRATR